MARAVAARGAEGGRGLPADRPRLSGRSASGSCSPTRARRCWSRKPSLADGLPVTAATTAADRGPAEAAKAPSRIRRRSAAPTTWPTSSTPRARAARPKARGVAHRNVVSLMAGTAPLFAFSAADVWTLFHSYAFDFSVWEMWGALLYGGRVVVVSQALSRSPEQFYDLLARERVTVLNQTPSAFRQLMSVDASRGVSQAGRAALRRVRRRSPRRAQPAALVRAPRRRLARARQHVRHHRNHRARHASPPDRAPTSTAAASSACPFRCGRCICWMPAASRCRQACPARSTWAAPA